MSLHVMLDLETLSTRADAAVIQIAALAFDPSGTLAVTRDAAPAAFNEFVREPVGYIDVDTVAWWMQRPAAARVGAGVAGGVPTGAACLTMRRWFESLGAVDSVWCHGGIDFAWLEHAFTRSGCGRLPWSYKLHRDTRTLYALTPGGMPDVGPADPEREHDAAYDCERQVAQVCAAFAVMREAGLVAL